ncbi:sigma-70 family RNA polymerase sigma factor [Streptomyces sp. uw30]|uniref:sigma-70 family RNA polymerase sigma factor n=1 Tax=Streptomyces sp. uw30 TaxID=1828179 RepID=UPI0011CEC082|nr:sigma-70 family RNA polymerase sigma factor [Streptomyces sp. uw30]TXS35375.1 sigma-70 family RNA polymerase sigma factor [Streptomyces sp. uw30]
MSDGSPKVPAQASPHASATASYARIYEEQQPRLVAFARSLTRNNSWAAEDLVAEAHFRVWRRLSEGHEIENVPAYLMTTVRHLAATAGAGEARETPHDPRTAADRTEIADHAEGVADPAEQVSSVDLLVRVLGQLPERWVQALWLAEAEGQPLEAVGQRIGAKQGATAVLLHRAREGMRQAFLRSQTGAPDDPACEVHWVRMPAYVRGNATPRQSERLLAHVDACDDCRGRLAVLMRANDRLPALVGPALLVFAVGGAGKFLLPLAAGSAGAAGALSGQIGGALHAVRQAVTGGGAGAKAPAAVAAGATVAGAALAMMLALGTGGPAATPPSPRVPLAEAPVGARPSEAPVTPVDGDLAGSARAPEPKRGERESAGGEGEAASVDVVGAVGAGTGTGAAAVPATVVEPAPVEEPVQVDEPDVDVPGPPPVPPAPVEPPAPAEPAPPAPAEPAPADPVEEQPEAPEAPSTPEYPETPSTPETPEPPNTTPEHPEHPGNPGNPEHPGNPGNPESPTNPGTGCGN